MKTHVNFGLSFAFQYHLLGVRNSIRMTIVRPAFVVISPYEIFSSSFLQLWVEMATSILPGILAWINSSRKSLILPSICFTEPKFFPLCSGVIDDNRFYLSLYKLIPRILFCCSKLLRLPFGFHLDLNFYLLIF